MKKLQDIALNSDMLNKLFDKKLDVFQIFIVQDSNTHKYYLYLNDKDGCFEVMIAEFRSYKHYLRWLTEAAVMRACASSKQIIKVREIYKKMFFASRDPSRINPLKKED